MAGPERMILPRVQEAPHGHGALNEYAGIAIARQTNTLLDLLHRGEIRFPKPARDYLEGYTFDYLTQAQKGSLALYNWRGILFDDTDPQLGDAAHHAQVVFSVLPTYGMDLYPAHYKTAIGNALEAPKKRDDFLQRIRELRTVIWQMAEGIIPAGTSMNESLQVWRTFRFFRVASELPIKSTTDESKIQPMTEERFNKLLADVSL